MVAVALVVVVVVVVVVLDQERSYGGSEETPHQKCAIRPPHPFFKTFFGRLRGAVCSILLLWF